MNSLILVRHGATQPNLDGLRCGGDLDPELTDTGRRQIEQAVREVLSKGWCIDALVTSDLQRTHESAGIASRMLGGVPIVTEPALRERMLGAWNLQSVAATEAALRRGDTPPGGESNAVFTARIDGALQSLRARRFVLPLVIGSRGVARVMRERLGLPAGEPLRNGEVLRLDLPPLASTPVGKTPAVQMEWSAA